MISTVNRWSVVVLTVFAVPGIARAGGVFAFGEGFSVPDNNPAGASSSVHLGAIDQLVDTLGIHLYWPPTLGEGGHPWLGDLVAKITYTPDTGGPSVSCDLFNRVGASSSGSLGDSSDFRGIARFSNWGFYSPTNLWNAAAAAGSNSIVAGAFVPSTRNAALQYEPLNFVNVFGLSVGPGTWTLNISDHNPGNVGRLAEWSIDFFIPAPGTTATVGVPGLLALRRRWRSLPEQQSTSGRSGTSMLT